MVTTYTVTNLRYDDMFWSTLCDAVRRQAHLTLICHKMAFSTSEPVNINATMQRISNALDKFESIGITDSGDVCRLEENKGTLYLDVF